MRAASTEVHTRFATRQVNAVLSVVWHVAWGLARACGVVCPGVGVVRLEYSHANGFTTLAELVDYSVKTQAEAYLPTALGNRWRYRWQDQESGVRFEDVFRLAAHRDGQWELAFVTSARPVGSVSSPS